MAPGAAELCCHADGRIARGPSGCPRTPKALVELLSMHFGARSGEPGMTPDAKDARLLLARVGT